MTQSQERALNVEDFDYDLPSDLIAQRPAPKRDASRLMVLRRDDRSIVHRRFADITDYLARPDVLVVNDTRVMRARVHGLREHTGGRVEALLLRPRANGEGEALLRPGRRMTPGSRVVVKAGVLSILVTERLADGVFGVRVEAPGGLDAALRAVGEIPLPPYIARAADAEDEERYQCVYARNDGAVAAPTAGLHFTPELMTALRTSGVDTVPVTLHVGLGTFRPLQDGALSDVRLHSEWSDVSTEAAEAVRGARSGAGRVVAVGTTCVRTLESSVDDDGQAAARRGDTDLFIQPGHEFQVVDALVTNFHLPKSSLLMLVAAFAGYDFMREAYETAVLERYRFYSYGDAMLIL